MARTLSGTLLFSLRVKGGEATCAITLDDSSDREPRPLIADFFNRIGQTQPSQQVRAESALPPKNGHRRLRSRIHEFA
jgi:hypothetical protein